jgi:hypothetical protein
MKAVRKANETHSRFRNTGSSKRLGMLSCAIVAVAAIALPVSAAAAPSVPASGSLYFSKATAKVVGGTALVPVECVGVKGSICSGELSLDAGGASSEAPFSVSSGGKRIVSIPLSGSASSAVATAKTAQTYGGYATATEVLRLR